MRPLLRLAALLLLLASPAAAQDRGFGAAGGTRAADFGARRYHALLIGVSAYRDTRIRSLQDPVPDAKRLRDVLVGEYQFEAGQVKVLENPGRLDILGTLDSLGRVLGAEDNLVVFFAGHGLMDSTVNEGYWFPADAQQGLRASWIANADIRTALRGIRARHTLVISDACFSGGLLRTRDAGEQERASEELYRMPSRKAITSGTLTTVPDRSIFLDYLITRLRQNPNRLITANHLFLSLRDAVIGNSPTRQVPQYGTIYETGDEGGDFVFARRAAPAAPAGGAAVAAAPAATPAPATTAPVVGDARGGAPAPAVVATATTPSYDIAALRAKLSAIRFFESGQGVTPRAQRQFGVRFDSASARYINLELDLDFAGPPGRAVTVPYECRFHHADGTVVGPAKGSLEAQATWNGMYSTTGWGGQTPGNWRAGTWRAVCRTGSETIGSGTFEIAGADRGAGRIAALGATVNAMRFWEQPGGARLARDRRVHATSFDARTARFIGVELDLSYAAPGRVVRVPITCTRYAPNGSVFATQQDTIVAQPAWTGSYFGTAALGWAEPGKYQHGQYRVECAVGGAVVATGTFDVSAPVALSAVGGTLSHITFWEEGGGAVTAYGQRSYATRFDSARTRYIGVELGFRYPAPGRKVEVPIKCDRFRPDGTLMRTQSGTVTIEADWTSSVWTPGAFGATAPGTHAAGTYRVDCRVDGRVIASGSYEVTAAAAELPGLPGGSVAGLFFWEEGPGAVTPRRDRRYRARFGSEQARYIGVEIRLAHAPPGRVVSVPIACSRTRDGVAHGQPQSTTISVAADWTNTAAWLSPSGADAPGTWPPGRYRVECRSGDRVVGSGEFEVAAGRVVEG